MRHILVTQVANGFAVDVMRFVLLENPLKVTKPTMIAIQQILDPNHQNSKYGTPYLQLDAEVADQGFH